MDPSGKVHVAWSSGVALGSGKAYDTVVYTSSPDDLVWSAPLDIVALLSKGAVTRPALLPDPAGMLHMTYRSYMIYYTHGSTQAFSAPALLPQRPISSGDNGYFSELALDSAGRVHVFYTEYAQRIDCPECLHVYHRVSEDNGLTWSRIRSTSARGPPARPNHMCSSMSTGACTLCGKPDGAGTSASWRTPRRRCTPPPTTAARRGGSRSNSLKLNLRPGM